MGADASRLPGVQPVSMCENQSGKYTPRRSKSTFIYLTELKLDRRRAAEDHHRDAQTAHLVIDLFHHAVEIGEGTFCDTHDLTRFKLDLGPRLLHAFLYSLLDLLVFLLGDGRGAVAGAADETHHLGHVFHEMPGVVVHLHLHQDITGKEFPVALALLPGAHLHHLIGGHEYLAELLFHAVQFDALTHRAHHLVLETGINMHHIPAHRHGVSSPSSPSTTSRTNAETCPAPRETPRPPRPWPLRPRWSAWFLCPSATPLNAIRFAIRGKTPPTDRRTRTTTRSPHTLSPPPKTQTHATTKQGQRSCKS